MRHIACMTCALLLWASPAQVGERVSLDVQCPRIRAFSGQEVSVGLTIGPAPKGSLLIWRTTASNALFEKGRMQLPQEGHQVLFQLTMPDVERRVCVTARFDVMLNSKLVDTTQAVVSVFPDRPSFGAQNITAWRQVLVVDAAGTTASVLEAANISFRKISKREVTDLESDLLIVGTDEARYTQDGLFDELVRTASAGTAIILFRQGRVPQNAYFALAEPLDEPSPEILAPGHPLFDGIESTDLKHWNVPDGSLWQPIQPPSGGNFRVLVGDQGGYAWVLEYPVGQGRIIACQLPVIGGYSDEPTARIILGNVIRAALGEAPVWHPAAVISGSETGHKLLASLGIYPGLKSVRSAEVPVIIYSARPLSPEGMRDDLQKVPGVRQVLKEGGTLLAVGKSWEMRDFLGQVMKHSAPPDSAGALTQPPGEVRWGISNRELQALARDVACASDGDPAKALSREPLLAKAPVGRGIVVACTLPLVDDPSPQAMSVLCQLLTNLGVRIELSPEWPDPFTMPDFKEVSR